MTSFLAEYGLFLLKVLTFVIAILAIIFTVFMLSQKGRRPGTRGQIEINKMNDSLEDMEDALQKIHLDPEQLKLSMKEEKAEKKAKAKEEKRLPKKPNASVARAQHKLPSLIAKPYLCWILMAIFAAARSAH